MDFKMYLAENVLNERRTVSLYTMDDCRTSEYSLLYLGYLSLFGPRLEGALQQGQTVRSTNCNPQ